MTTPVYNSADRLIRQAYADAGYLQEGSDPTTAQYNDALSRLNDIINFYQTSGLKMWTNLDYAVTLVAGTGTYSLTYMYVGDPGPKPMRVLECYYQDADGIRRPLTPMSWNEWTKLSQVNQLGAVNSYFVDKRVYELSMNLWNIPDTTAALGTVHVVVQRHLTNAVSGASYVDFPSEWYIALRWALADELATGQPQAIMDRCQTKALYYKEKLEGWDVEDASTSFQPDTQRGYNTGGFR